MNCQVTLNKNVLTHGTKEFKMNRIEDLISMHTSCIDEVLRNDYYVNLFFAVVDQNEFANIDELRIAKNASKIVSFWNSFWFVLPDTRSIHRHPFNLICDICEYDYREYDE